MAGLYDFMYREYHPTQGRWLSPDPAGLAAVDLSNPQSLNRYAYALNSPTNLVDPLGLNAAAPWDDDGGGGGIPGFCPAQYSFEDCGYGGGGGWFPPIPIPGGGGGGGGGGTGGSTGSGSGPNTGGLPPTGGETLGIPNGFPIGGLSMCQLMGLCPIGPDCEFGACTPIPSGYVTGVSGNGTSQSPFTISVFVWASMHICGDFICDQHGNTVSLAPPNIRGIQPTNIEFDILLGGFYLSRINSNPFLRIGPGYVKGGRKILRVVSGGPGVGWWWHIWDGPTWPF
jgi:RHS repeat-associated protein